MAVEKSSVCKEIGESNSSNTTINGLNTTVTLAGHGLKILPENITSSLTALDLRYNLLEFSGVTTDEKVKCELNDLSRFERLTHLNIADNKLAVLPSSFGKLVNLEELNIVGNGLSTLHPEIEKLSRLSRLYADFNQLSNLPTEMGSLYKLTTLSLGHNNFTCWPPVLERLKSLEIVILTGNCLTSLLHNTSSNLTYLDVRANNLHGIVDVTDLKKLQHLDISYNCVNELNVSPLSTLRSIDCSYNQLTSLIMGGNLLQVISARNNKLQNVQLSQSVEKLEIFDVSFNLLSNLPDAICDASQLIILDASHNKLPSIPTRLLNSGQSQLQVIKLNHNQLKNLPDIVNNFTSRCLHFQHNLLSSLPVNIFTHAIRLEELNVAHNRLVNLPLVASHQTLPLRKLYLSSNLLNEDALLLVSKCPRLQVLHFAYNGLQEIPDSILQKLPDLRELSFAANQLDKVPPTMISMPFLENLNLHSNNLEEVAALSVCPNLKAIDLACNKLKHVSLPSIVSPQLNYLDLSCNEQLHIDPREFDSLCSERSVAVVNVNNRLSSLPFTPQSDSSNNTQEFPWTLGFTETFSGTARLCIDVEKKSHELSIAVVECSDSEQAELLRSFLPQLLRVEKSRTEVPIQCMCNASLAAFRLIKTKWPSSEPAITLCSLALNEESVFVLRVVSIGHPAGCLLSENGDHFLVTENMDNIPSVGQDWETAVKAGFTTSNESINEFAPKRKMCFISEPQVTEIKLKGTEKYLIVGSYDLWEALDVSEILQVVQKHNKPVQGSKHLAELASTLGNKEGICATVVVLQLEKINIFCNTNSVHSDSVSHDINLSVMNFSNNILNWNEDDDKIQNDEVIEDAEKYKSWEYMLEQNHKMLFNRELETIHRSFICRTAKIQNNATTNWCSNNNTSAPYTPTFPHSNGFPTFRGRYYCYGYYDKGKMSF